MSEGYLRIRYEPAAGREDELAAELWQAGCLGTETRDLPGGGIEVIAWFAGDGEGLEPRSEVARAVGTERVAHEDWMAVYRERARPVSVGRRLLIDPREPDLTERAEREPAPRGRFVVRVPAREAFGTGSHESTRLALELLEDLDPRGRRVLDVGAGSGVLSFAAELLGAGWVVGVELDLVAALLAGQNRTLNGLSAGLVAGSLEALETTGRDEPDGGFDLAVVNVLPHRIRRHLPRLAGLLADGATVIFSGIPADESDRLRQELADLGLRREAIRMEGEWVAFRLVKRSAAESRGAVAG